MERKDGREVDGLQRKGGWEELLEGEARFGLITRNCRYD